jgi:hypothetical protein
MRLAATQEAPAQPDMDTFAAIASVSLLVLDCAWRLMVLFVLMEIAERLTVKKPK